MVIYAPESGTGYHLQLLMASSVELVPNHTTTHPAMASLVHLACPPARLLLTQPSPGSVFSAKANSRSATVGVWSRGMSCI